MRPRIPYHSVRMETIGQDECSWMIRSPLFPRYAKARNIIVDQPMTRSWIVRTRGRTVQKERMAARNKRDVQAVLDHPICLPLGPLSEFTIRIPITSSETVLTST